jgi:Zn-dependent oligopeptidase
MALISLAVSTCSSTFQDAVDATLSTFLTDFELVFDATLSTWSSNFKHVFDATLSAAWSSNCLYNWYLLLRDQPGLLTSTLYLMLLRYQLS